MACYMNMLENRLLCEDEMGLEKQEEGETIYYVKDWCETVLEEQQEMLGYFGEVDWDVYKENELNILKDKISLLLGGIGEEQEEEEQEMLGYFMKVNRGRFKESELDILKYKISLVLSGIGKEQLEGQKTLGYISEVDWDRYKEKELNILKDEISLLFDGKGEEQQDEEKQGKVKKYEVEVKQDSKKKLQNPMQEFVPFSKRDENQEKDKKQIEKEKKDKELLIKKQEKERKQIEKEKKDKEMLIEELCDIIARQGMCELEVDDGQENDNPRGKYVYMVYIFVFWKDLDGNCGCWPVFRVPKDATGKSACFIDMSKRVYSDWKDFLENNQFPPCEYCYPRDGKYYSSGDRVVVDFGISPAAKIFKKILNGLDVTSSVLAMGATAVTIASLTALPVAAPVLAGTAWLSGGLSCYTIFRSSSSLIDRSVHKQSIGFRDREARSCYISILATAVGFGASAGTSATLRFAQNGRALGKVASSAVTALNGGALVMNGAGVINGLVHLIEKKREDQLTPLDVAQFSASLLLFCHAAASFKTARSIIENTQNDFINDFNNGLRSKRHQNAFKKLVKNTVNDHGNMDGKALVIRSVKNINNVDDFFASMVRTDKQFRYVKSRAAFAENGNIKINGNVDLDPTQLSALNKNERISYLRAAQKFSRNKMNDAKFKSTSDALFKDISMPSTNRFEPAGEISKNCSFSWDLMETFPYLNTILSVAQQIELSDMLKCFPKQCQNIILQLTTSLFTILIDTQRTEYMDVAHFVSEYAKKLLLLCYQEHKKYILDVLKHWIRPVPSEEMTNVEFCLAVLKQLLLNPTILLGIFQCVKSFFCILLDSTPFYQNEGHVNYMELVLVANILLKMNRFQWKQIIDCAQIIFNACGFKKISKLVEIIIELCSLIEEAVISMIERHCLNGISVCDEDDDGNDDRVGDDSDSSDYWETDNNYK